MSRATSLEALLGGVDPKSPLNYGVLWGLEFPKPASGLTATYTGGIARLAPDTTTTPGSFAARDYKVAGSTKLFTASKDTYVYLSSLGVLSYSEQTLGAAKPTLASLSAPLGQYLWKVVTDGSDITAVYDLRQMVPAWLETVCEQDISFVTAEQGATTRWRAPYRCRLVALHAVVRLVVGGTDTGTVTPARVANGTSIDIAGAVITAAISAAVGVKYDAIPTIATNPEFGVGDELTLTSLKTTTGGILNMQAIVERLG